MNQANFDRERGVTLLATMERIRAFEENAVLAAERDKIVPVSYTHLRAHET